MYKDYTSDLCVAAAPSSPSNARGRGREQVLREHLKDDSCVALSTPLKLKQAARATPVRLYYRLYYQFVLRLDCR